MPSCMYTDCASSHIAKLHRYFFYCLLMKHSVENNWAIVIYLKKCSQVSFLSALFSNGLSSSSYQFFFMCAFESYAEWTVIALVLRREKWVMFAWQPLNWECVLKPKRKVVILPNRANPLVLQKLQLFFSTVLKCVNSYGDGLHLPAV